MKVGIHKLPLQQGPPRRIHFSVKIRLPIKGLCFSGFLDNIMKFVTGIIQQNMTCVKFFEDSGALLEGTTWRIVGASLSIVLVT
jgi:hypothetical protein